MNVDELLAKVKYKPDTVSHLQPDNTICQKCKNRICEYVCPAKVYEWDNDSKMLQVTFENCLECGACRIACPHHSISWNYPVNNKGITFKNS